MSKSTAATSEARRAQLERLKEQRRAERAARARVRLVAEEAHKPFAVTLPRLAVELQRLAMGDVMPSPAVYDHARPGTWPRAEMLCEHFGMDWGQLAAEAGLRIARGRGGDA